MGSAPVHLTQFYRTNVALPLNRNFAINITEYVGCRIRSDQGECINGRKTCKNIYLGSMNKSNNKIVVKTNNT